MLALIVFNNDQVTKSLRRKPVGLKNPLSLKKLKLLCVSAHLKNIFHFYLNKVFKTKDHCYAI